MHTLTTRSKLGCEAPMSLPLASPEESFQNSSTAPRSATPASRTIQTSLPGRRHCQSKDHELGQNARTPTRNYKRRQICARICVHAKHVCANRRHDYVPAIPPATRDQEHGENSCQQKSYYCRAPRRTISNKAIKRPKQSLGNPTHIRWTIAGQALDVIP